MTLILGSSPAHALGPFEVRAGFLVDYFSESYGLGDLFSDLEELPDLDPSPDEAVDTRIRSSETLPGAYLGFSWRPPQFDRYLRVNTEYDEISSTVDFDGLYTIGLGGTWRLGVNERFRMQWGVDPDDRSRDLLQSLEIRAEQRMVSSRFELVAVHEFSEVASDSLGRLYDYELVRMGARFSHPLFGATVRWRVDGMSREVPSSYSSDQMRWRAGLELYNIGLSGWTYDIALLGIRRAFNESGLVSPSDVEGELRWNVIRTLNPTYRLVFDGELITVRYDDPDVTYFTYHTGRVDGRIRWVGLSGLSLESGMGVEWLRPEGVGSGRYDQGRLVVKMGYFGLGGTWFDVENAIGLRNYMVTGNPTGILLGEGSLSPASDFIYNELTVLFGFQAGILTADLYGQYTVESHAVGADDVSFFLMNARTGVRF